MIALFRTTYRMVCALVMLLALAWFALASPAEKQATLWATWSKLDQVQHTINGDGPL